MGRHHHPSDTYVATPPANERSGPAFRWLMILFGVLAVSALAYWKFGSIQVQASAFIALYTILVTSFELSRLFAATGHRRALRAAYDDDPEFLPGITFVVPCLNEQDAIGNTIAQCLAADYPAELVEVIVVNDGSTDGTAEVLTAMAAEQPQLIVVNWADNRGKRAAMAEGFRRARGEIIIQLDSDSYIEPASLRHIVAPFANPDIGAVCAHADPMNADDNILTRAQAAYYFVSFRILKAAESSFAVVFCCSGCSSAYRRDIVLPILDEWENERFLGRAVTWGDDRGLTNRVLAAGYSTIYTDRARAYTICPDNLKTLIKQQIRWKKGWLVNSIFASRFIVRRAPFVAFTYLFPLMALTLITPFAAARALIYEPLVHHVWPLHYAGGILVISLVVTIFYRYYERSNRYWPYVFLWSGLNLVLLSFLLPYAIATIQNRKWGTRSGAAAEPAELAETAQPVLPAALEPPTMELPVYLPAQRLPEHPSPAKPAPAPRVSPWLPRSPGSGQVAEAMAELIADYPTVEFVELAR